MSFLLVSRPMAPNFVFWLASRLEQRVFQTLLHSRTGRNPPTDRAYSARHIESQVFWFLRTYNCRAWMEIASNLPN